MEPTNDKYTPRQENPNSSPAQHKSFDEKMKRAIQAFREIMFGSAAIEMVGGKARLSTLPYRKVEGVRVGKRLREEKWIERYGGTKKDLKEWFKSERVISYPDFLKEKYKDGQIPGVKYMTDEERDRCIVEFRGGCFYLNNKPLITSEAEMLFVISPEGKTHVTEGKEGELHHSTPLAGRPILSGGDIITNEEGRLTKVRIKSGHYRIGQMEGILALRTWQKNGVDLKNVGISEKIHTETGKTISTQYNTDAKEYLEKRGNVLPITASIKSGGDKKKIQITPVGENEYSLSEPDAALDFFLAKRGFRNIHGDTLHFNRESC